MNFGKLKQNETNLLILRYRSGKVWYDDLKIEKLDTSNNEILVERNYYPFGMEHKGYNSAINTNNIGEDWRFNGMEHQDDLGLNTYDFGARMYMPELGRTPTVDPLADRQVCNAYLF